MTKEVGGSIGQTQCSLTIGALHGHDDVSKRILRTFRRRPLHIEVEIHAMCPTSLTMLRTQWNDFFRCTNLQLFREDEDGSIFIDKSLLPKQLLNSCANISVEPNTTDQHDSQGLENFDSSRLIPVVHTFILSSEEAGTEELDPCSTGSGGDDEWTAACDVLELPHGSLQGLWGSLIFDETLKTTLLDYAQSALLFSDKAVSSHVVTWNRMVLLYGPAGTGKTSLCRALAHKLAVRLGNRFPNGTTLLEVHSHSLFSKWFSTSGKLVSALFQLVRDMVQDEPQSLVCVLIDEVESLAMTRGGNSSSGDPSDAMRAVNSLLTSLDRLKSFPNVLVLATTNLTDSVDAAFIDRVDLKLQVGMPILEARYEILRSCLIELQRVGIIHATVNESNNQKMTSDAPLSPIVARFTTARSLLRQGAEDIDSSSSLNDNNWYFWATRRLMDCSQLAEGLSGRSLRRLPLQAHAQFLNGLDCVPVIEFLDALYCAIQSELDSRASMAKG